MIPAQQPQEDEPFVIKLGQLLLYLGITITSLFLFSFVGVYLVSSAFNFSFSEFLELDYANPASKYMTPLKLVQLFAHLGTYLLPALLISQVRWGEAGRGLLLNRTPSAVSVVGAIVLLAVFYPFMSWTIWLNQQMALPESWLPIEEWMRGQEDSAKAITRAMLEVSDPGSFLLNILVIAIVPAIGEELFFRGAMQRIFGEWTNGKMHVAVFLAAFIFSFIHFQFYGFLPRFLLGVLLGYLFLWSGSVWVPIIGHFMINFTAVLFSYLATRGVVETEVNDMEMYPTWLVLLSAVATVAVLVWLYRTLRKPPASKVYVGEHGGLEGKLEKPPANWVKVFVTQNLQKAEILAGSLEAHEVKAFVMNKKDSAYSFGEVEIYVREEDAAVARRVIDSDGV